MSSICPRIKGEVGGEFVRSLRDELLGRGIVVVPYGMEQTIKFGSKVFLYERDLLGNKFYALNVITQVARSFAKEIAKQGNPVVFRPTLMSVHRDEIHFEYDADYLEWRRGYELTFSVEFAKRD